MGDKNGSLFVEFLRDKVLEVVTANCKKKIPGKKFVDKTLRHLRSRRRKLNKRLLKWSSGGRLSYRIFKLKEEIAEVSTGIKNHAH